MTIILPLTIPHRLCSCLDEREELLVKLKAATSVDLSDYVISTTRASAKQCEPADVISEYIEVVEDISSKLMQSVQRQEEVLKDILVANDNFIKARKSDPITLQRDKMVRIGVMFVMYYVVYLFDSGYCNATEHLTVLCAHFLFSLFFVVLDPESGARRFSILHTALSAHRRDNILCQSAGLIEMFCVLFVPLLLG
jgi:ALIX V-shaped domain binding to HIV